MDKKKQKANEAFFDKVHGMLHEGEVYIWIDQKESFKREGDFLLCSQKGYDEAEKIVSPSYMGYRFKVFNT